ncbi:MAG: ABC transporter ATP-binding protein [Candidatus Omnitrophica bacterium]|nr:ABC transporter ATP-binding protein [Candidatus Omnitrophota bacterium]
MKNYLKLLSFLKAQKRLFLIAVLALFVSSFFEGIQYTILIPLTDRIFNKKQIVFPNGVPEFVRHIVDQLNVMEPAVLLNILPWAIVILMLVKHAFVYVSSYLMNDVSQRVIRDIRDRLYTKIQSFSLDYFSERRTGELLSRITNDVAVIENAISYGVTDLFRQSFLILIYVTIAFSIHFKAACVVFFILPLIGWPMSRIGAKLKKLSRRTQENMADVNSILLETISGVRVVKAFSTEQHEIGRFRVKNQEAYKLRLKSVKRMLLMNPITEIFGLFCGIGIILWMGRQVMDEQLSFGVFAFFLSSILLIISPLKKLGNVNAMTQQALAANERIYDVLDQQPTVQEKPNAMVLSAIQRNVKLENVSFRYESEGVPVLQNINLEIKVGELVAIVGPTGTGKSTLANLIPRFYDVTQGCVTVDGQDVRDVTFESLRHQIGIVSQETFLFNDTVGANISYGTPQATQKEVETAAQRAYAHQFISKMPEGYQTIIGDRGFRLSGGEKQRIAIARAILRNPPILILDEATSQLDSESEKFVQEAVDKLMVGRTVIAIAHRLSTIRKANKIVVLDKGGIVGLGPHEQLLTSCNLYKRLYETQFQQ